MHQSVSLMRSARNRDVVSTLQARTPGVNESPNPDIRLPPVTACQSEPEHDSLRKLNCLRIFHAKPHIAPTSERLARNMHYRYEIALARDLALLCVQFACFTPLVRCEYKLQEHL